MGVYMKVDYQKIIDQLKAENIIKEGDKYSFCVFVPESTGTYTITSKNDYIIAANSEEVKLLAIDQKTGEYLGKSLIINKCDLVYVHGNKNWVYASKNIFGGRTIVIRLDYLDKFNHSYYLSNKFGTFVQKTESAELYNLLKEVYNTHFKEQKKLYKESK